ncbi:MAG: PQQ-binding-like beta-propeller repeat protein [Bacteroidales bacterium]|nr:PQQ-binding-like beta-propeller repeat protein [Bacteroidales bacterium]
MKLSLPQVSGTGWMIIVSMILVSSCTNASNKNWPQFRGPDARMIAEGENLPDEWGEDLNVAWTYEVEGDGWASPVVWGNRIFLATVVPEKINKPGEGGDSAGQENQNLYLMDVYRWEVSCVDLLTGEEIWKRVARRGNPRTSRHPNTNYAGETPVTDGEKVYVYFGMNGLYCFTLEGELVWEKDLGAYETQNGWGTGASPLLYEGRLYVQVDNEENSFLLALDPESGEEIWRVKRDEKTSYSTPFIWKNSKRTELVTGGLRARSYDPLTGELFWELRMDGRYSIPGPVASDTLLFMGNAGFRDVPGTFFAIKAGAEGDISPDSISASREGLAWFKADAPTGNPSPLLYEGLLYLLGSRGGELACLDAETGEIVYQEKLDGVGACWASPWAHADKIFFTDERGITKVIRAGREFEFLHENSLDDRFWASVAVAGDAYIFKGDKKLYCIKK